MASSADRLTYLRPVPDTIRVNLWSGPRNVSTALMYSFAQRADTRVVDEPLYAHYLRVSGADHPGRDEVLAAQANDARHVIAHVMLGPCDRPVIFFKQMTHHLVEIPLDFLGDMTNVLLVRDPEEMLPSLAENLGRPTLRDTGLERQSELLDQLEAIGQTPPVLEARELLLDPAHVLSELCGRLGLAFDPAVLSWTPGPRPEDGIWAPHWYRNVHRSTGFLPYRRKTAPFPRTLRPLLDECRPHYDRLRSLAIEAPRP